VFTLLRVYNEDGRVIHAETLDREDAIERLTLPPTGCRCIHMKSWNDIAYELAERFNLGRKDPSHLWTFERGRVSTTPIYPSPRKDT
jgi:hypothetical protein